MEYIANAIANFNTDLFMLTMLVWFVVFMFMLVWREDLTALRFKWVVTGNYIKVILLAMVGIVPWTVLAIVDWHVAITAFVLGGLIELAFASVELLVKSKKAQNHAGA